MLLLFFLGCILYYKLNRIFTPLFCKQLNHFRMKVQCHCLGQALWSACITHMGLFHHSGTLVNLFLLVYLEQPQKVSN